MISEEEKKLLAACRDGSKTAFRDLTRQYYRQAYSMALYWTGNPDTALDISQEAFIRVYRNLSKFDLNRSFKAWLFTIVKHLSFNYTSRRRKKWTLFSDLRSPGDNRPVPVSEPPAADNPSDTIHLVRWAMAQLKEKDRDIILLKDFENYSYQEISELLKIPLGTVMSRLFNARKKLGEIIGEECNV